MIKKIQREKKAGIKVKILAKVDEETKENYEKRKKIVSDIKPFENRGVAIGITDDQVLITLTKKNVRDEAFVDVMKRPFELAYENV